MKTLTTTALILCLTNLFSQNKTIPLKPVNINITIGATCTYIGCAFIIGSLYTHDDYNSNSQDNKMQNNKSVFYASTGGILILTGVLHFCKELKIKGKDVSFQSTQSGIGLVCKF